MVHYKQAKYNMGSGIVPWGEFYKEHGRFPSPKEHAHICKRVNYKTTLDKVQAFYGRMKPRTRTHHIVNKFRLRQLEVLKHLHS